MDDPWEWEFGDLTKREKINRLKGRIDGVAESVEALKKVRMMEIERFTALEDCVSRLEYGINPTQIATIDRVTALERALAPLRTPPVIEAIDQIRLDTGDVLGIALCVIAREWLTHDEVMETSLRNALAEAFTVLIPDYIDDLGQTMTRYANARIES